MRKLVAFLVLTILCVAHALAENWPQWRGPSGNGVSAETGLPVDWDATRNIAWKAELGGTGVSTPVVFGDLIFVTSQAGRGEVREGRHPTLGRGPDAPEERSISAEEGPVFFLVEAYDRTSGRRVWQYRLESEPVGEGLQPVHRKHNLSSPSPATDGELVYAWFGTGQLVALDTKGKLVWQKHLAKDYSPFDIVWGHSSSPSLYQDKIFLLCDHDPASYLLALDKRNGKQLWKADRGKGLHSYSTPTIVRAPSGDELIVNSSQGLDAYDPNTGEKKWFFTENNRFPIPVPSFSGADGVIYTSRGYRSGPYMAIRPGGSGNIAEGDHVVWHVPTGAPYVSSVIQYEGIVFLASDSGILQAADAKTGKRLWQSRTGGVFSAAPVAGDGKVYFASETGEVLVLKSGRTFELLANNDMGVRFLASPAIAGGQLILRTDGELIAIRDSGQATSSGVSP